MEGPDLCAVSAPTSPSTVTINLRRGGEGVRQFLGTCGSHPDEDAGAEGEAAFRRRARFVRL